MVLAEPDAKRKVRVLVQRISTARGKGGGKHPPATQPHLFFFPSTVHKLAALVDQYGPVVSLRRGSHVTIIIGRMDVRLVIPTHPVVRSRQPM